MNTKDLHEAINTKIMPIPSSQHVINGVLLIPRIGGSIIWINFISEIIENAAVKNKKMIQFVTYSRNP